MRDLAADDVREWLRHAGREPTMVVASLGEPLHWLFGDDVFAFWKSDANVRIADPHQERRYLIDFPGEEFYEASEWCDSTGDLSVIVLQHFH